MCFVNRISYCNSIMIIFLILYFSGTMITQLHTLSITYFVYFLSNLRETMFHIPLREDLTTTGPVVQKVDNAIHQALVVQTWDSTIHWVETSKFSGQRYSPFEQLAGAPNDCFL